MQLVIAKATQLLLSLVEKQLQGLLGRLVPEKRVNKAHGTGA